MRHGTEWLRAVFGRRADAAALAYRRSFDPATAEGQVLLRDLASYCRVLETSFVPGDPYQTAFNEGARDVFLHVVELSKLTTDDFMQALEDTNHE